MSNRLQNLYNEYNKRELEIEQSTKNLKECISDIEIIRSSITPEIVEIINQYNPSLLDMLNTDTYSDLSKVEDLKANLNFVIDNLFKFIEGELL